MALPENNTSLSDSEQKPAMDSPSISLPKGGGAIRGIGEKFAANTGTGSMTVPIATSPGRSGFGPQLFSSYDSDSGNGSFFWAGVYRFLQLQRKQLRTFQNCLI